MDAQDISTKLTICVFIHHMKKLTLLAFAFLSGCNTIQNQYVDAAGTHGSGTTTFGVAMDNGKFSITDKGETCSGEFSSWQAPTVIVPVKCTSGKSGAVTMTRPTANASQVAGEGTMAMTDGTTRRFIFGPK